MTYIIKFTLVLFILFGTYANAEDIPVSPVSIAKSNLTPPPQRDRPQRGGTIMFNDQNEIVIKPGTNEIIRVAVNHLNRIVTPFESPKVTTVKSVTTEVKDNVIYIATGEEDPITLFITEGDVQDLAISLTLIPQKIPPREISLRMPPDALHRIAAAGSRKAENWETSQPYISTIEALFKSVALQEIPPGYRMSSEEFNVSPVCREADLDKGFSHKGLSFSFKGGQVLVGHHLVMHIGVVSNITTRPIEFVNALCGDWNVAAVATFPHQIILPGESTEVYVAIKKNYQRDIRQQRPSLIKGMN